MLRKYLEEIVQQNEDENQKRGRNGDPEDNGAHSECLVLEQQLSTDPSQMKSAQSWTLGRRCVPWQR